MCEKTLFQELVDGLSEEEIYELEKYSESARKKYSTTFLDVMDNVGYIWTFNRFVL